MRAARLWGNKKLRWALIGVAVAVLVGVAWLVWPERHEDLTLRLKFVGSGDLGGKPLGLFRVEGAEQCDIIVKSYRCLHGTNVSPVNPTFSFKDFEAFRLFRVESQDLIDHGWQVQPNVAVVEREKKLRQFFRVLSERLKGYLKPKIPSVSSPSWEKPPWKLSSYHVISEQTLTSELITNTPH